MDRRTFLTRTAGGAAALGVTGVASAQQANESSGNQSANESAANSTAGGSQTVSGNGKTHTVEMYNNYFDPVGLHVKPGDTVKWVIKEGTHTATSYTPDNADVDTGRIPEGAQSFNSGNLSEKGATYTYTFTETGTYDYYCVPHKQLGMVGRIVCGEPGGPGTEGSIPNAPGSGVMPSSKDIVDGEALSYPYVPGTGGGGPPALFWAGLTTLSATAVYLLSVYDRRSGRYSREHADGIQEFQD